MKNQTYSEALMDCIIKLGEALEVLGEAIKEQFGHIKEFIEQHEGLEYLNDKPVWNTPKKLVLKSQVFNKKPMMARARSCC
jgi:hypothetical protein